ncbi:beta-1,3-glucanase family protein [Ascidiimonas sp. W6]|uniref:beta-1,3-glucanase family protein n=1 Tax=Ascidiimonas meishanensis TaxID=3128903 RepID=UPI0030EEC2A7
MQASVSLKIHNTSGMNLVIAFLQGSTSTQSADQLAWLKFGKTPTWDIPNKPKTNADLAPYIMDIADQSIATVVIPAYIAKVGFRCLVADTNYKTNALQKLGSVNYMAFPDLMTADYYFDKFEAGLTIGVPGIWNITSVDFVGIPMQLTKGSEVVGYKNGVTAEGLHQLLNKLSKPYNEGGTIAPNKTNTIYRFFAPSHIDSSIDYLDQQIKDGLTNLQTNTTTVNYGQDVFSNFTTSSKKVTNANGVSHRVGTVTCNSKANGAITIADVTTVKAVAGTIAINGNSSQVLLGALLASAICRGVLGNPKHWGDIVYTNTQCATPWNYYPSNVEYDEYSKLIHEYSINGKNYGFSYDDYFGDEAGFNVVPGEQVTLDILPISGNMTATPNPKPQIKKGCLAITIPQGTTANLGEMYCDNHLLDAITNKLCFVDDTVVVTFHNYPSHLKNPEIHIDLTQKTASAAISYYNNGTKSTTLSVTGLYYSPDDRQLSFGLTSKWT